MPAPAASGHNAETYSSMYSYRDSPSSSHISLPSINSLPSLSSSIGAASQHQHPQAYSQASQQPPNHQQQQRPLPPPQHPPLHGAHPQHVMGSPLPPPAHMGSNSGQYPYPPGQHPFPPPAPPVHAMSATSDPNAPGRYAIPAPDGRMLSGTRHKKEIKRRTKTGCLTCRKRRIKCDEGHPTCRNCIKSKRECLGYDPIFKAQPGPTNIQPAPNSTPSSSTIPATTSPYSQLPPTAYPPSVPHPYHAAVHPAGSPAMPDYNNIDPALQGPGSVQMPAGLYDGEDDSRLEVKPTNIEELLNVGQGYPPPNVPQKDSIPSDRRSELTSVYLSIYGQGMDKFFDTHWFTGRGHYHLLADQRLCEKYLALMDRFTITAQTNYHENLITQSLEAHVIWESLLLCRQVSASILSTNDSSNQVEVDAGVHDVAKRLRIFESLVTNQQLDTDFAEKMDEFYKPKQLAPLAAQLVSRERDFWKWLAVFCSLKDDSSDVTAPDPNMDPAMASSDSPESDKIDGCLKEIRQLLDSRENRDILYSVAIARHIGQQMAEKASREGTRAEPPVPVSNDEANPKTALTVARTFIREESDGKGTTQVAQRICGMAKRSWGNR